MTSEKPLGADLASHLGYVWIRPRPERSIVYVDHGDGHDGPLDKAVPLEEVHRWCEYYITMGYMPSSPQHSPYRMRLARIRGDAARTPSKPAPS